MRLRFANPRGVCLVDLIVFGMQASFFDHLRGEWLKRAEPDVQRHVGDAGAGLAAALKHRGRDVETRRGRRRRSGSFREDGIITVAIRGGAGVADVRRPRHMTDSLKHVLDIALALKSEACARRTRRSQ
jgi:hypothetical protein